MADFEIKRLALKVAPRRVLLLEWEKIYYVEAARDDTWIRTARRRLLRHVEPLEEVEQRLPSPPFFRVHRSFLVNLDRVLELRTHDGEYELRMDPPVNRVLPVSRRRYSRLRDVLGI